MMRFLISRELDDLGKKIWREDTNRVLPGTGYRLNLQANSGYEGRDYAPQSLFTSVDSSVLQKPTFKGKNLIFYTLLWLSLYLIRT